MDDDRIAVNSTLQKMLAAKAQFYEEVKNDWVLSRFVTAFSPVFVPRTIGVGQGESEGDAAAEPGESAVARMKRRMRWRGDAEEAPWFEETGWSLLILACSLDDEPAVDELLALPEAELRRELDAKGKKGLVVSPMTWAKKGAPKHRAEPFAQLFCAYAEEMTALLAAMTFARPSIVTKLLDVGANVKRSGGLKLLGDLPCHFRGSILAGRLDNTKVLLDRHPEYLSKKNALGSTVLHFACMIGRTNDQLAIVKDLLARGPASNLTAKNLFFGTPLQTITTGYDSDPAAIQLLIEAGDSKLVHKRNKNQALVRFVVGPLVSMLGKDKGEKTKPVIYGMRKVVKQLTGTTRSTPAHAAAVRGDVGAMKMIASQAPGAMTSIKDKSGKTALEVALEVTGAGGSSDHVPKLIEQLVRQAEGAQQLKAALKVGAAPAKGAGKYQVQVAPE